MEHVTSLLTKLKLECYIEAFAENGFDSLEQILEMGPQDLDQLGAITSMLAGHLLRLKQHIRKYSSSKDHNMGQPQQKPTEQTAQIAGSTVGPTDSLICTPLSPPVNGILSPTKRAHSCDSAEVVRRPQ